MTKPKNPPQILSRDDLFRMCELCDKDRRALREEQTRLRTAIKLTSALMKEVVAMLDEILKRPEL